MNEYIDDNFNIKLEDGIVYIAFLKEFYNYDQIDLGIKKRLEIVGDNSYPMFSDFRKVKSGTREARQRFSEKDAGIGVKAVAVYINSKVQKIMFNFFNSIYKAPAPTRIFTDKEKALKWLEQYK